MTSYYIDNNKYFYQFQPTTWSGSNTNTYNWTSVTTSSDTGGATPACVVEPAPLEWLRRRVEEICDAAFSDIAA